MSAWFEDTGASTLALIAFFTGAIATSFTGSYAWMLLALIVCAITFLGLYAKSR